ncbi:hypothetical protein EJ04DRAFT_609101 [Polyplosphaeria fusca]|uniref:F-box domain-containing protein n=1 Tax=Polyplosphaeria fusca TaxID=682080 RepID=A0A9P4QQP7_9PLEO|nr:hypothetical protein EJ04DRAFT_609101 [Polyplosphaeria fusca]
MVKRARKTSSSPPRFRAKSQRLIAAKKVKEEAFVKKATKNGQSQLLALPGEIRNEIYSYCKEYSAIRLDTTANRKFYSLTQVCRAIRSDFVPIYAAETEIWVGMKDIEEYVQYLVELYSGKKEVIANIVVNLGILDEMSCTCEDFLPLIMQYRASGSFTLQFAYLIDPEREPLDYQYYQGMQPVSDFAKIFLSEAGGKWDRYMRKAITKIKVVHDLDTYFLGDPRTFKIKMYVSHEYGDRLTGTRGRGEPLPSHLWDRQSGFPTNLELEELDVVPYNGEEEDSDPDDGEEEKESDSSGSEYED